jgi:hypothetical protein
MQAHLDYTIRLMRAGGSHDANTPKILEVDGISSLRRVTTSSVVPGRARRYFLEPDDKWGWRILSVEVECAVCKRRGSLHGRNYCSCCQGYGWHKVA